MSSTTTAKPSPDSLAGLIGIVPYNPVRINKNGRTSTVLARIRVVKKNELPASILTCLQVKSMLETSIYSTEDFTTCCNCGDFELEHLMRPGLRHLKDNNPLNADIKIPRKYLCHTLWIPESKSTTPLVVSPCSSQSSPPRSPAPNHSILSERRHHSTAASSPPKADNRPFHKR